MTSDQTKDVPGVEEQRRMTEEINQRIRGRGECVWYCYNGIDGVYNAGCRKDAQELIIRDEEQKFCPYCGGTLVVK